MGSVLVLSSLSPVRERERGWLRSPCCWMRGAPHVSQDATCLSARMQALALPVLTVLSPMCHLKGGAGEAEEKRRGEG